MLGLSLGATAVGGILFGALADRFGRKSVLQATILTYSAGALMTGLSPDLGWLLVSRVITALGVGGEWATGHAMVAEAFPPRLRGRFGALMQTGAPLGVGLAALAGSFLAPAIGWRATFVVSALPALLVTVIRRHVPESDVWARGRSRRRPMRDLVTGPLGWLTLRAFLLTTFNMSAYWITFSWLPTYLREERGMGLVKSGLWILLIVAGELAGYLTFGLASDRWGRRRAFSLYASLMGAGLAGISLGWDRLAAHPGLLMISMAIVGVGTGTWSNFGPYFSELFPTSLRSTAMGTVYNAARGIQFAAPIVVAALAREAGLSAGIALAGGFAFAAALWIWTLPETIGRTIGTDE